LPKAILFVLQGIGLLIVLAVQLFIIIGFGFPSLADDQNYMPGELRDISSLYVSYLADAVLLGLLGWIVASVMKKAGIVPVLVLEAILSGLAVVQAKEAHFHSGQGIAMIVFSVLTLGFVLSAGFVLFSDLRGASKHDAE
jgi:hypothetical protein